VAANAEAALAVAERALVHADAAHALIGACARNMYAPPRPTRDLNFAVVADVAQYARLRDELRTAGFTRVTETRGVASTVSSAELPNAALFSDKSAARIDLLLAHSPFERQAIARAVPTDFASLGVVVPIVRVEDLIVYKVLASRPHDLVDIQDITRTQEQAGTVIDWAYVESVCAEWDAIGALHTARRG
jgi:hypothetical protein